MVVAGVTFGFEEYFEATEYELTAFHESLFNRIMLSLELGSETTYSQEEGKSTSPQVLFDLNSGGYPIEKTKSKEGERVMCACDSTLVSEQVDSDIGDCLRSYLCSLGKNNLDYFIRSEVILYPCETESSDEDEESRVTESGLNTGSDTPPRSALCVSGNVPLLYKRTQTYLLCRNIVSEGRGRVSRRQCNAIKSKSRVAGRQEPMLTLDLTIDLNQNHLHVVDVNRVGNELTDEEIQGIEFPYDEQDQLVVVKTGECPRCNPQNNPNPDDDDEPPRHAAAQQ